MKKWEKRRWQLLALGACGLIALALVLPAWTVCTDYIYVCQTTGSSKGHREWFTGHETGAWYERSALEAFMRKEHPDLLEHRWVTYAGTGKDLFGNAHSSRHGFGPLHTIRSVKGFNPYVNSLTDAEKLALYEFFASAEQDLVRAKVDEIWETSLGLRQ